MAEDAARELSNLPLEDALQLVHLYAEQGSPKYEKAAMRWPERYLTERLAEASALCGARDGPRGTCGLRARQIWGALLTAAGAGLPHVRTPRHQESPTSFVGRGRLRGTPGLASSIGRSTKAGQPRPRELPADRGAALRARAKTVLRS